MRSKLKDVTSLSFYELDLSACYLRILTLFIGMENGEYLHRAVNENDLWSILADTFLTEHPDLSFIGQKFARKVIKIKALSMINGGGLNTKKDIESILHSHQRNQFALQISYYVIFNQV